MEDITLDQFTFDKLPTWSFVAIVSGARGSGKTVLAEDFLFKTKGRFSHVYLCSGSEKAQPADDYFPTIDDHRRFSDEQFEEVIERLFAIQEHDLEKNERQLDMISKPLVVLDDMIGGKGKSSWSSKSMLKLCTRGRHVNISCLFLTQNITTSLSKGVRANVDVWFVFRSGDMRLSAFLIESFLFYGHHNKKTAYQILKWAWSREPHTTLTVCSHLIGKSERIQDFVFTYKAEAETPDDYELTSVPVEKAAQ